jgi:hypothetical protein
MGALRLKKERELLKQRPSNDARPPSDSDPGVDFIDIPAAIVCALCGSAECPGCAEERTKSGIVAIVPWERAGSLSSRLWSTARSTTLDAERFFHTMPDGPVIPALRFAVLAEVCASAAMLALFAGVFAAIFPAWAWSAFVNGGWRTALAAVPGLAVLLVAAHAVHGLALDVAASRRKGLPTRLSHGLRFGLYACGWDLVVGPLGFCITLVRDGAGTAFGLGRAVAGLPTKAALAFLRGVHHLEGEPAKPALRASYVAAAVATIISAFVVLGVFVALAA